MLGIIPCAIQKSFLVIYFMQQLVSVNPMPLIYPSSHLLFPFGNHKFVFCESSSILYIDLLIYFFISHISDITQGFPGSSVGKESTCNAGDPGSTSGSGRSTGERTGYPLQYPWISLVAQLVKNPPTMWRPGFDPQVGKIPWRREQLLTPQTVVHGVTKSRTTLSDFHFTVFIFL